MKNLTVIENELIRLIHKNNKQPFLNERDAQLIEALEYVATISQDGELKTLLQGIKHHFPEYGK